MHIAYTDRVFHDASNALSLRKEFGKDISLYCHIAFLTETFMDYQKDIFEEFLSEIVDLLSEENVPFSKIKGVFEKSLQDLNEKLQVFADKIKDVDHFQIKWVIQIMVGTEYLASLIGSVWLVILRKQKLQYMLSNQQNSTPPIDQFSEFVEWEVKANDKLLVFGVPVDSFLDKDDIDTILAMSLSEETLLLDAFREILKVRLSEKELSFMLEYHIESNVQIAQKKLQSTFAWPLNFISKYTGSIGIWGFERFQAVTVYVLIWIVSLVLIVGLIQSFEKANEATFVNEEWGVVINVTIEDIQKDIALFKKIDPSSDQKIMKYNEIIEKLDLLESNNRWTYDVNELRKILETEYYKGFNIILANQETFFSDPMYEFTQLEKNTFGQPNQVFYNNGLLVGWSEWVLLGAVNNEIRGTLISAWTDTRLRKCGFNLLRNGLYCISSANQVFNIVTQGVQPMATADGAFPTDLRDIGTFGSSNMYLLTDDDTLVDGDTYIVRYKNQVGSQEQFAEGLEYIMAEETEDSTLAFAWSGFASFAIDGTFLIWSPVERTLYQLRRPDVSPALQYREIPLEGGDNVEPYSSATKVIGFAESRFVYLFDPQNQTFTVYRSLPYKTNSANTTSYRLAYFFRIKFSLGDVEVTDVYVEEWEKSVMYALTANGVYQIRLHEYIEQYFAKEAEEAQ